jgi:prophage antirepressor-like protein
MSTDLIAHAFHGHTVRVETDEHGDPWFVAADVAKILGYSATSAMTRRLDDDDKGVRILHTLGGEQEMSIITEPGLYVAVIGSQVPLAQEFKRWVTREVLPSIRRTGSYGSPSFDLTRMDDVALLLQAATNALSRVRELEPPAAAWEAMADSTGDYSMRDAAQVLDRDPSITTGQNRLSTYLRQIGWIDRRGIPYQRHVDLGRIRSKAQTRISHRTGERVACEPQVRLTLKGLGELHRLLRGSEPLAVERHLEVVS